MKTPYLRIPVGVCLHCLKGYFFSLVCVTLLLSMSRLANSNELRARSEGVAPSFTFQLHEHFPITVDYSLTTTQQALIYARPRRVLRGGDGGAAHHEPLPVAPGEGSYETWLCFFEPAEISGVDLFMVDLRSGKLLARTTLDVDITWGTEEEFHLAKDHSQWMYKLWSARRDIENSRFASAQTKFETLLSSDTKTLPRQLVIEAQMGLALVYDLQGKWQPARQQYDAVAQAVESEGDASFSHRAMRLNATLVALNQQFEISWKQGRLGECRAVVPAMARQADELQSLISGLADGRWWAKLYASDLYAPWRSRYNVARLIASSGQRDRGIDVMATLSEDIHRDWCEHRMGRANKGTAFDAYAALAEWYLEAGDTRNANELLGRGICFHYTKIERSFRALQELWRGRIQAMSGADVDTKRMANAVAKVDAYGSIDHRMQARYSLVRLLVDLEDWPEAVVWADDAITFARKQELRLALVRLLTARTEIRLELGDLAGAEADVREALVLAREAAQKVAEPKLYYLYAQISLAQNDLSEAWRLLEAATDLARRFQQPWIEKACAPEMDALANIMDEDKVPLMRERQAIHTPSDHVGNTGGSTGERSSSTSERVFLFPDRVYSRVATNEYARARFCLVNPLNEAKAGRLSISGKLLPARWTQDVSGLTAILTPSARAENASEHALELPPRSTTEVYLEREPCAEVKPQTITMVWNNGDELRAQWEVGSAVDRRMVALVNISQLIRNPFYHVPFHHEIYYRDTVAASVDIKMHANQPCRLEVYTADQDMLIAVDADGNGRFSDAGDAVHVDANENGWPDLAFSPVADAQEVYLWVFPLSETTEPVEIAVSLGDGEQWTLQGIDVLSPLQEGAP
ncbi:MAG: hypothetical protein EOM20_13480 [Spartobacteria bacterium]|nr:hypothetical protein [Spartobacteria bacterium]